MDLLSNILIAFINSGDTKTLLIAGKITGNNNTSLTVIIRPIVLSLGRHWWAESVSSKAFVEMVQEPEFGGWAGGGFNEALSEQNMARC